MKITFKKKRKKERKTILSRMMFTSSNRDKLFTNKSIQEAVGPCKLSPNSLTLAFAFQENPFSKEISSGLI